MKLPRFFLGLVLAFAFVFALVLAPMAFSAENIPAGKTVTLFVTVDGSPYPTVEWFKDGVKVGTGENLELGVLAVSGGGTYTATATNEVGSATSEPIQIVVTEAPVPPNPVPVVSFALGTPLTLRATAGGTPAPRVEFFKDGVSLGDGVKVGDEYTIDLGLVVLTSAGTYTARASNLEGSALSDPVRLAVNAPPAKPVIGFRVTGPTVTSPVLTPR